MTYRLPSLNSLRAFEAAARSLSFRSAAGELGVTSGAVSQQVKKLEQSLGVDLFQRLPHGLLLTEAGAAYLPKISKVFEDLTSATEDIAPDINGKKFTVGVSPEAEAVLPNRWPLGVKSLSPFVRDRVVPSTVEDVQSGLVECLVQSGDGATRNLDGFEVTQTAVPSGQGHSVTLVCKASLAHCR